MLDVIFDAAFGHYGHLFPGGGIWNQAQESHWRIAGIAELVHFIRSDQDNVTRTKCVCLIALVNFARSLQHIYFVLVRMVVTGRMTTGRDGELAHGKVRCPIFFAD